MNELVKYRREFHKYPESGWNEIRTSARVGQILTELGVDEVYFGEEVVDTALLEGIDLSSEKRQENLARALRQGADAEFVERTGGCPGVMGVIRTGKPGPVYALRFDMDSLPYDECRERGYRPVEEGFVSVNTGRVHACGHDAHTAIGLGLARRLMEEKESYTGTVKLIFQPAEEVNFGALSIVSKGHLDDVDGFLAVHLALSAENVPLPSHTMCCGVRDFMSCRQIDVTFHGHAAHPCGAAQEGKNALLACASAAMNLHGIAMHEKGLGRVNVGAIHGGDCTNTICPECCISLEYRGQYREITEYFERRVFDILEGTARQFDMTYSYVDHGENPAGASDLVMMEIVEREAREIPWFEKVYFEGNLGGTDDAAAMMNRVQEHGGIASYIGIGCDTTQCLHNPGFDFDEDCMGAAVELLERVLRRKMGGDSAA